MIDDDGKIHVVKGGAVMRLGIDDGETLKPGSKRGHPFDDRNAKIAQHGQIVRTRHFIDAGYGYAVYALADQALKGKGSGNGVRIGADQHHPVIISVEQSLKFGQTRRKFAEIGHRFTLFSPVVPRGLRREFPPARAGNAVCLPSRTLPPHGSHPPEAAEAPDGPRHAATSPSGHL